MTISMARGLAAMLVVTGAAMACTASVEVSAISETDAGDAEPDDAQDAGGEDAGPPRCEVLEHDPRWSYEESEMGGPSKWGDLTLADGAIAYPACANAGVQQSPIALPDVDGAVDAGLPSEPFALGTELRWSSEAAVRATHHNGHTWQAAFDPAQSGLTVGATSFALHQFHFHAPAEHAVGGEEHPLEVHFVHLDPTPGAQPFAAVVAVMFDEGEEDNPELEKVWPRFAECPQEIATPVSGVTLDLTKLLPEDRSYLSYDGSLTTPPCSVTVKFHVLLEPLKASKRQIARFQAAVHKNDRPHQPILESTVIALHPHAAP